MDMKLDEALAVHAYLSPMPAATLTDAERRAFDFACRMIADQATTAIEWGAAQGAILSNTRAA